LSGANASGASGLDIAATNCTIRGFVINRWSNGIFLDGAGASFDVIEGNYIGTDGIGAAASGNGTGIDIGGGARSNTVGGTTGPARNIISGNSADGVDINGPATFNVVEGNFIGTDLSGTVALANSHFGINMQGTGPSAAARGNIIGD